MNKMKNAILLVLLGLVPLASRADESASWLLFPTSTRQAALSGAIGALVDDVDALGVNPAGLTPRASTSSTRAPMAPERAACRVLVGKRSQDADSSAREASGTKPRRTRRMAFFIL